MRIWKWQLANPFHERWIWKKGNPFTTSDLYKMEGYRLIFDVLVIVIMAIAVGAAFSSNNTARDANEILEAEFDAHYRPFINLTNDNDKDVSLDYTTNDIFLHFKCKNHGTIPGLIEAPIDTTVYINEHQLPMNLVEHKFAFQSSALYPDETIYLTMRGEIPPDLYDLNTSGTPTSIKFTAKLDYDGIKKDKYWTSCSYIYDIDKGTASLIHSNMGKY
ncbi:MAG: hypothetical protein GY845_09640 [Planctomycetes bacterium]|nr:hypothetical protein [Planctomycetota bacterium]